MFRTAGRGGAAAVASASVVCLAALAWSLTGTSAVPADRPVGGTYVVVGAADPGQRTPDGTVTLLPPAPSATTPPANVPDTIVSAPVESVTATATHPGPLVRAAGGASPGAPRTGMPPARPAPARKSSARSTATRPAHLTVSAPRSTASDRRWCQTVTVVFGNSGGLPVTSGRATLVTHVVDLLGIDWATYRTTLVVPVPIARGERVRRTYGVCLRAWQVLPGTHMETRRVVLQG